MSADGKVFSFYYESCNTVLSGVVELFVSVICCTESCSRTGRDCLLPLSFSYGGRDCGGGGLMICPIGPV